MNSEANNWTDFLRTANRRGFAYKDLIGQLSPSKWTPVVTFATPGDTSVSYLTQIGLQLRIGPLIAAVFNVTTSAFSLSSGASYLEITGLTQKPVNVAGVYPAGSMEWEGLSKTGYTSVVPFMAPGDTTIYFDWNGIGQSHASVVAADTTNGTNITLAGSIWYFTDAKG